MQIDSRVRVLRQIFVIILLLDYYTKDGYLEVRPPGPHFPRASPRSSRPHLPLPSRRARTCAYFISSAPATSCEKMLLESDVSRSECLVTSALNASTSGEIRVDFSSRKTSAQVSPPLG